MAAHQRATDRFFVMSRLSPVLVIVLALALPAVAAEKPGPGATDLEIVDSAFGRVVQRTYVFGGGRLPTDPWGRPLPRPRGAPPPQVVLQREAYVLVRNVGARDVESVEWSFVFYSDAKRETAVARYAFNSKERIRPGEMKFLAVVVKEAAPTSFDSVTISRIRFTDGTSVVPVAPSR
ncbi:MAG: hypothetical protein IT175_15405 [Acidobacteria bacterium]|nr:hypothetical protein [Acidobacteriota bacterium]